MLPRLPVFSSFRRTVLLLACVLMAARPFPALAAGRAAAVAVRTSPLVSGRPIMPRLSSSTLGGLSNSQIGELNRQAQLDRLSTNQNYEIVSPPQLRAPKGSLHGYQIVPLGRGHNNRLCLAATVADTKGLMMLDTGANNTALSDTTYRALRLGGSHLPAGLPKVVNLNGTNTPLAEAPDFVVAKSDLGAVPVCLVPRRYLFDTTPLDPKGRLYDGLLGENILRHYNAVVDCGRLLLYLNLEPARKLDLGASFARRGWTRVPMSDIGNDFTVPCVLNGHPFRLIVDTGSPFTNLDRHLLETAQIGSHDLSVRSGLMGADPEPVGLVDLDRLQIGNYTATGVHMTTTSQSLAAFGRRGNNNGGPIIGLLGGDILAGNGAVVDIGGKALYLKHPETKAAKPR